MDANTLNVMDYTYRLLSCIIQVEGETCRVDFVYINSITFTSLIPRPHSQLFIAAC